ncbi:MAG: hypothetical protein K9M44_02750 [Candidatus Pacebacteria bacterium]|nr:hypothetical protein [Candidatus Paceibacterota bacterium]
MKLGLFSSKQKKKKPTLTDATDFLNPADINSAEGMEEPKKFKKKRGGKSKKEDNQEVKVEVKEVEKAENNKSKLIKFKKNKKNKYKKEDFENKPSDRVEEKEKISQVEQEKQENKLEKEAEPLEKEIPEIEIKEEKVSLKDKDEIKEIISEFEEERRKKSKPEAKKSENISDSFKKSPTAESIFVKSRIQEVEKGVDREERLGEGEILEINLVKDQVSVFFDWYKNLAFLVIFIFLAFLLVAEVYWALSWWQNYNQNSSNYNHNSSSLVSLSQEIREIKGPADKTLAFQNQLSRVSYLLENHIYWTEFFDYLEENTLEGVKYASFSGGLTGRYSFSSIASDYPLVGRQAQRYFESELVIDVSVDSASLEIQGEDGASSVVNFNIDLEISPEIFKK